MKKLLTIATLLLLSILILSLFLFSPNFLTSRDQAQTDTYKIGILAASESRLIKVDGIIDGLGQYGLSSDSYEIIIKNADNNIESLPALAQELVDLSVDIIVTTGTYETSYAKDVTLDNNIPVIFVGVGCASEMGFVEDNITTGCNITGIDSHYVQLSGKRLEYLKRLVPDVKTVLVLYNPTSTPFGPSAVYLFDAATKLEVDLEIVPVTNEAEVFEALNFYSDQVDGIMLLCSLLFEETTVHIAEYAIKKQLPVMGINEQQVEEGVLASYGITRYQEGVQASRLIANILKGQRPEIMPVEAPVVLEFHVNSDTASRLGLELDLLKLPYITKLVGNESR